MRCEGPTPSPAPGSTTDQTNAHTRRLSSVCGPTTPQVLELRLQNGRHFHPRLAVSRKDAKRAVAVVQPFVPTTIHEKMVECFGDDYSDNEPEGTLCIDRLRAPAVLVPLSSLGRRVEMVEGSEEGVFDPVASVGEAGGDPLQACTLTPDLFAAAAMFGVERDLMKMTVLQLKEELEARGASRSGALKSVLRGRLRAIIIAAHGKEVAGAGAGGSGARKRPREAGGEAEQDVE